MDLFKSPFASNRALWVAPLVAEVGAPERRLIHARCLRLPHPTRLDRLGVRLGQGYFKCGSTRETDWADAFRVLIWNGEAWEVIRAESGLAAPDEASAAHWFDLDGVLASSVSVEVRRSSVDGWWPSWNVAASTFVLEGDPPEADTPPARLLTVDGCDLDGLPTGIAAELRGSEIFYRTRFLQIGFRLGRTGLSFLALDDEGKGRVDRNLLGFGASWRHPLREFWTHGIRMIAVGGPEAAGFLGYDAVGSARVAANAVTYDVQFPSVGQRYRLRWEVREDRIQLSAERQGDRPIRAWESSAWQFAFDSRVTPVTTLGEVSRSGQAGLVELPLLVHAPGHGTLQIESSDRNAQWRADVARPVLMITDELKIGEIPQAEGDYLLPAGSYRADLGLSVTHYQPASAASTAPPVERALRRCALTALTYRPDTATLSNNGGSMHAPLCLDNWSALATRIGRTSTGLRALDLVRDTLERWLLGAPGYASGRSAHQDHFLEDEYLMTGPASFLALAEYLRYAGSADWVARFREAIEAELRRLRARDLDGDGLIESPYRLGISGEHQWSTNWWDVISFGWKDAFVNALLYPALRMLAESLPRLGHADLADGLAEWANQVRASYVPAFFNPETGWFAGWRCKDDRLHDSAFLFVNGAAVSGGLVDAELGREILARLWEELERLGLPNYRLGLPGNLWPIPDADLADPQVGLPMGCYQNGGLTHSQARHFVAGLYQVGLTEPADRLLRDLCETLGDGTAFSGCGSGVDWRRWDGSPSGYEGLLCDQFGVLIPAFDRYTERQTED